MATASRQSCIAFLLLAVTLLPVRDFALASEASKWLPWVVAGGLQGIEIDAEEQAQS
jgi:hypothetical protein